MALHRSFPRNLLLLGRCPLADRYLTSSTRRRWSNAGVVYIANVIKHQKVIHSKRKSRRRIPWLVCCADVIIKHTCHESLTVIAGASEGSQICSELMSLVQSVRCDSAQSLESAASLSSHVSIDSCLGETSSDVRIHFLMYHTFKENGLVVLFLRLWLLLSSKVVLCFLSDFDFGLGIFSLPLYFSASRLQCHHRERNVTKTDANARKKNKYYLAFHPLNIL